MTDQDIRGNYNALGLQLIEQMYSNDYLSIGGVASTDTLIDRAGINQASQVLDVGCGLGGPAMHVAQTTGCHVTGLDLIDLNIAQATQRASRRGLQDQVRFVEGNATSMPFDDGQFDVVIGQDAWCHVPDKAALIGECRRVLKPGGVCAFTDWVITGGAPATDLDPVLEAAASRSMGSTGNYLELLTTNGFEITSNKDISQVFITQYQDIMSRLAERRDALAEQTSDKVVQIVFEKNGAILRGFERRWIGGVRLIARKM